jgi:hypothetical protein
MENLINKIKTRASNPSTIHDMAEGLSPAPQINAVVALAEIQKVEEELGFKFPDLWKKIYSEIGNGGFGPGYGLYPLQQAKEIYLELMSDPENEWEKGTFPLCTWGCAIDSYVDCADEEFSVYFTDEGHSDEGNEVSFELTDKDGNVISTGKGGGISDILDQLSGGGSRPPSDSDDNNDDDDDAGLSFHKNSLEDWFNDWTAGVDLWSEMDGGDDDYEEEDDDQEEYKTPPDSGRGR